MNTDQKIIDKVQAKVMHDNGCHLWSGNTNASGYGVIRFERKRQLLHRVMYRLTKGEIAPGLVVMHTCDRRTCVNPDHLVLGTINDNTQDMLKKGRAPSRKGERNGNAKLTEQQAAEIRSRFIRYSRTSGAKALAAEFNVTDAAIHAIVKQQSWT